MAIPTLTLAGNDLNDGTTYILRDTETMVIPPLAVVFNELVNYDDGSSRQVNVRPNVGGNFITFSLRVVGATADLLETALANLTTWSLAGGELLFGNGTTTILDCMIGVSLPPTRIYDTSAVNFFAAVAAMSLERLT